MGCAAMPLHPPYAIKMFYQIVDCLFGIFMKRIVGNCTLKQNDLITILSFAKIPTDSTDAFLPSKDRFETAIRELLWVKPQVFWFIASWTLSMDVDS